MTNEGVVGGVGSHDIRTGFPHVMWFPCIQPCLTHRIIRLVQRYAVTPYLQYNMYTYVYIICVCVYIYIYIIYILYICIHVYIYNSINNNYRVTMKSLFLTCPFGRLNQMKMQRLKFSSPVAVSPVQSRGLAMGTLRSLSERLKIRNSMCI